MAVHSCLPVLVCRRTRHPCVMPWSRLDLHLDGMGEKGAIPLAQLQIQRSQNMPLTVIVRHRSHVWLDPHLLLDVALSASERWAIAEIHVGPMFIRFCVMHSWSRGGIPFARRVRTISPTTHETQTAQTRDCSKLARKDSFGGGNECNCHRPIGLDAQEIMVAVDLIAQLDRYARYM
ncbi:hypothetical protein R3P38DRAFT_1500403 [Favolaschia claudopus]|uniref:Uncharacterized protein n=1 Tax=Favolaschia claudopus TaxID=2862362 RepID=A0AAW0AMA4_9AGAR